MVTECMLGNESTTCAYKPGHLAVRHGLPVPWPRRPLPLECPKMPSLLARGKQQNT